MEGKIKEDGSLQIKRGLRMVNMMCPYSAASEPCGEWCPQFSEPMRQTNRNTNQVETIIHICQNRHWKFSAIEDRRGL